MVLNPFIFKFLDPLLGLCRCLGLRLLHVFFHVGLGVFTRFLVQENRSLAFVRLFVKEALESHLGQVLVLFQSRHQVGVLILAQLHRRAQFITSRELAVNLILTHSEFSLVEGKSLGFGTGLEDLSLVPLLHGAVLSSIAGGFTADVGVGSHH